MSGSLIAMTDDLYDYLHSVSDREDPRLAELRRGTADEPRANMQVSPMQGQFMQVLVRAIGARKILEVGVYTGYSSLAMALALPAEGRIVALDVSEEWTSMARPYWERAGVAGKIDLRLGPATQSMAALLKNGEAGTFDLIFIDANKPEYHLYWDMGLDLLRQGGLIIADNTLFQGSVPPALDDDRLRAMFADRDPEWLPMLLENTHAIRAFNERIHKDERVTLSMIPVGDGMTLGVKL